jgi:hypothetical protein
VGEWGPVVDWPVIGVHVALLPNGKVLAYDSIGDNATGTYPVQDHIRATVWDPATGTQTPVTVDTGFNIFCSGLAHLVDGRMFMAGRNKDQQLVDLNAGVYAAELWSPATGQWRTLGAMQVTRQYHSTALLLPDGRVLSSGGGICGTCDQVG